MVKSEEVARCLVIQSSVTDHKSVEVNINLKNDSATPNRSKLCIDRIGVDMSIGSIDFTPIYKMLDANAAAKFLSAQLTNAIKSNTKTIHVAKRKRLIKPWLTPGLLKCMKHRDNLHKKSLHNPDDPILSLTYKRYRNFCNTILKKTRRAYERQLIRDSSNSSKKLCGAVNSITQYKKSKSTSSDLIALAMR